MWNQTDAELAQQRAITVIYIMLTENSGINSAVQLGRTAVNSYVQVNECTNEGKKKKKNIQTRSLKNLKPRSFNSFGLTETLRNI